MYGKYKLFVIKIRFSEFTGKERRFFRYTVVGDYITKMKTTFDFNFYSYQAVKQHGCT